MSPRALTAPLHRHTREDEYSYVLEGRIGALLGAEVLLGNPGDLIFKPRNQWHTCRGFCAFLFQTVRKLLNLKRRDAGAVDQARLEIDSRRAC